MNGRCCFHHHLILRKLSSPKPLKVMASSSSSMDFLSLKPYAPPSWASHLDPLPSHVFSLAHLPTPIHRWNLPKLPANTEVWLKRDDLSGMQLSGNKVRKLEFLMADAIAQAADSVITIGGIQSNHCRATAVAAKYLNLDPFLILRTSKLLVDQDPGLTGNLLVERLVGAHVQLISKEEYAQIGSVTLTNVLKEKLIKEGRRPYVIPVGGSNSLGTWGYIEAIREIELQIQCGTSNVKFDDIVVACGSGGTIAGLSLGSSLSTLKARVHAFSVCDDPYYFHNFVQGLLDELKAGVNSRDIVRIQNVYAPAIHEKRKLKNGSYSVKPKPLFPGCIFLRCVMNKPVHDFIREYDGVGGFVGSKVGNTKRQINKPRPVSEVDMEAIFRQAKEKQENADQEFEEQEKNAVLNSGNPNNELEPDVSKAIADSKPKRGSRKTSNQLTVTDATSAKKDYKRLTPGSTVRIISGTFSGFAGTLKKLNRKTKLATVHFTLFGKENVADLDASDIAPETN